jgi:hypothetical protein
MGKWLNELRQADEISGNGAAGYRQNRQNPHPKPSGEGSVSSVSRLPSRFAEFSPPVGDEQSDGESSSPESQTAGNAPRASDDASPAPARSLTRSGAPADSGESAADRFEERAALIEYGAGVPREWAEGFARLDLASPPVGFDAKRWRTLIDDGGKFLDRWGGETARLGWSALDLFGAHPVAPAFRYDAAGLVNLISGGDVVDIRTDRAVIRTPSGTSLTYYLRRLSRCGGAVGSGHRRQVGGAPMNAPAPWEHLLRTSAQRCLAYLRTAWQKRPQGQDFVIATFDDFGYGAGVSRACVRSSLDQLIAVQLVAHAGTVRGRRGHPRNAFRLPERT